jgi:hypothetical protein
MRSKNIWYNHITWCSNADLGVGEFRRHLRLILDASESQPNSASGLNYINLHWTWSCLNYINLHWTWSWSPPRTQGRLQFVLNPWGRLDWQEASSMETWVPLLLDLRGRDGVSRQRGDPALGHRIGPRSLGSGQRQREEPEASAHPDERMWCDVASVPEITSGSRPIWSRGAGGGRRTEWRRGPPTAARGEFSPSPPSLRRARVLPALCSGGDGAGGAARWR